MYNQRPKKKKAASEQITLKLPENMRKHSIFGISIASMILLLSLFFIPMCSYKVLPGYVDNRPISFKAISVLSPDKSNYITLIVFCMVFAFTILGLVFFLKSLRSYSEDDGTYAQSVLHSLIANASCIGVYFLAGLAYATIRNTSVDKKALYSPGSAVPLILMGILAITLAIMSRGLYPERAVGKTKKDARVRLEFLIYGLLISAITVAASLSDIIKVTFVEPIYMESVHLNGFKIFSTFNSLSVGFQLVAFVLFTILTVTITLAVCSLFSFVSRSDFFYRITLYEIISGASFSLLIGLFGKYYQIVQRLNEDGVLSWLDKAHSIVGINVKYKLNSPSFYYFLGVMAIVAIVILRKPYSRGMNGVYRNSHRRGSSGIGGSSTVTASSLGAELPVATADDPCPAFTQLDNKEEEFITELGEIMQTAPESPTLSGLVQFIVSYARDSRLHLSYQAEDIAAFIAGLGATRLTILQGMSGTGKTSLPKIFSEAIYGNCEIIEIESSWRDKNELLGYYNEFSRTYTPKKFTQALYKATLNPERVTFIVLDEMNLSRIEYYFSDFLSLMENEEDKRQIRLLGVPLYRKDEDELVAYHGLVDGHTIKIPTNVWFIGTANRDESTFEISDKVYDRAHTMNFNKRAPKVLSYGEPLEQRYMSTEQFVGLLEEAKEAAPFDISQSKLVQEVEELLAPYNISFGNRIANQIEAFVAIYCACFTPSETIIHEALEKILLSKVVSKLEVKSIDNKEQLAAEFKKRRLLRCSEFILKLNED